MTRKKVIKRSSKIKAWNRNSRKKKTMRRIWIIKKKRRNEKEFINSYLPKKDKTAKIMNDSGSNQSYSQKDLDNVWKNEDYSEVISGLSNKELNNLKMAHRDIDYYSKGSPAYEYAEKYIRDTENKAATQFLDRQKSVESKISSHNAYKSAYEDYMKKHPNSKLTLNKFIDMSEGK